MGKEPIDPLAKKFQLELGTFGKRVKPKLTLMEDLQLCLDTCKTPEVKKSLQDLMRMTALEFEKELRTTESRLQREALNFAKTPPPPTGPKKPDPKKATGKLKLEVDKTLLKIMPNNLKIDLWFKPKPKNEFPFIDPKKSMLGVDFKYNF